MMMEVLELWQNQFSISYTFHTLRERSLFLLTVLHCYLRSGDPFLFPTIDRIDLFSKDNTYIDLLIY